MKRLHLDHASFLLLLFWAACSFAQTNPVDATGTRAIVAVTLNARPVAEFVQIWRSQNGSTYLPAHFFIDSRLRLPKSPSIQLDDETFYPVDAYPGAHAEFDESKQLLTITLPGEAFADNRYDLGSGIKPHLASPLPLGGFLNYDMYYARNRHTDRLNGLAELGLFGLGGTFLSRHVGLDLNHKATAYRLDSQFTKDLPEHRATVVVGDAVSGRSSWSRQVNFGGLQWKTNFSTTPHFKPVSLPSVSGVAAVPGIVELYADNLLLLKKEIEAGPFTITDLPVLSNQGNFQAVVRDVLGRPQVYQQPYIVSPQLLKQGIRDESYEIGALHVGYGSRDSHYATGFVSGSLRYGLSNSTTVEGHAELTERRHAIGIGAVLPVKQTMLVNAGVALSRTEQGAGQLGYFQLDTQRRGFGFGIRAQVTSHDFWQLGLSALHGSPKRQVQGYGSWSISQHASLSLAYLDTAYRNQIRTEVLSASLTMNAGKNGAFSLILSKSLQQDKGTSATLAWVMPLSNQRTLHTSTSWNEGNQAITTAQYQQAAPVDGGWGYRLRADRGNQTNAAAGIDYITETGFYNLSVGQTNSQRNVTMQARGGFAFLGGHLFASQWLDSSFAAVEIPVHEPVDIYVNNRKQGTTNNKGVGFIRRLVPYEMNKVYLDESKLPLDVTFDSLEQNIVPPFRSGLLLKFSAGQVKGANLILVDESGDVLPRGTKIRVQGRQEEYQVALRGEVFIHDIELPAKIRADSPQQQCNALVTKPAVTEPLPRIGPILCKRPLS